ncbi:MULTISPECIES: GMC family oxidoreductase [Streptomyces]|uniref:GMC family oxidoreductase n=1 Tax=Streptomyces TaxID=1883 RepID=UPI000363B8CA|nr:MULTISPECIES: GMC family oxidoreductase N-terminal domain-containing protein [Streptomyces]MBE8477396.1 GMC family oxidoreductase N-terminal domain-containing protein [Streptomyces justiciae]
MTQDRHFDHVVVGGGAAGSVVATRLSERDGARVLLLEAGPLDTTPAGHLIPPLGVFQLQRGEFDWCDETVPQPELHGRKVPISSGRVLGGGGAINFLSWCRGTRGDYDGWAERGMKGWGWDDLLPSFRRAEDNELGDSEAHARGGPIAVTTPRDVNPMSLAFVTACLEFGLDINRDFNSGDLDGAGLVYSSIRNGERSNARDYLVPAMDRAQLTVQVGAVVRRVLLNRQRVVGVQYLDRAGRHRTVSTASVVLCAGALRSPQILMLSGIGPAQHLADLGIEVAADVQGVGANLHDHPTVPVTWPVVRGRTWNDAQTEENIATYAERRRGPLAVLAEVAAYLRCGEVSGAPDIQVLPAAVDFSGGSERWLTCMVSLLSPVSRGQLRLRSVDPSAKPLIDPRYLTESSDRQTLVEGIRRLMEIAAAPVFRVYVGEQPRDLASAADSGAVLDFVRRTMVSINHPVGTCRAGTDSLSVVDPELRVHGVDGLRVIDASVMPDITRAPTHAAAVVIGERGSELMAQHA